MGRHKHTHFARLVYRVHERDEYSRVDRRYLHAFVIDVLNELVASLQRKEEIWIPFFGTFVVEENTPRRRMKQNAGVYRLRFHQNPHLQEVIKNIERSHPDDYVEDIPREKLDSIRYGEVIHPPHVGFQKGWKGGPGRTKQHKE